MMDRRAFVTIVGGGILAVPLAVKAQQPGKVYRIGLLASVEPPGTWWEAFLLGMREKGWLDPAELCCRASVH